jgi:hypothetical protein
MAHQISHHIILFDTFTRPRLQNPPVRLYRLQALRDGAAAASGVYTTTTENVAVFDLKGWAVS